MRPGSSAPRPWRAWATRRASTTPNATSFGKPRNNAAAGARLYGLHPSIIAWDLSNEWLSFLGYGSGNVELAARQMESMSAAVAKVDPTCWTFYNGDEDLLGLHNVFSTHYMVESAHPHPMSGFGADGRHSMYFPDGASSAPWTASSSPGRRLLSVPIATRNGATAASR